jgi:hypothetical protein
VTRWPIDLDLLPVIARLEPAFRLVATGVVTFFVGELGKTNGDELTPMSPGYHVQPAA